MPALQEPATRTRMRPRTGMWPVGRAMPAALAVLAGLTKIKSRRAVPALPEHAGGGACGGALWRRERRALWDRCVQAGQLQIVAGVGRMAGQITGHVAEQAHRGEAVAVDERQHQH